MFGPKRYSGRPRGTIIELVNQYGSAFFCGARRLLGFQAPRLPGSWVAWSGVFRLPCSRVLRFQVFTLPGPQALGPQVYSLFPLWRQIYQPLSPSAVAVLCLCMAQLQAVPCHAAPLCAVVCASLCRVVSCWRCCARAFACVRALARFGCCARTIVGVSTRALTELCSHRQMPARRCALLSFDGPLCRSHSDASS